MDATDRDATDRDATGHNSRIMMAVERFVWNLCIGS